MSYQIISVSYVNYSKTHILLFWQVLRGGMRIAQHKVHVQRLLEKTSSLHNTAWWCSLPNLNHTSGSVLPSFAEDKVIPMPAQETQCRSKQLVKDEIRSVALTKMIFSRAFSVFHIFKQHKSLFSSPKEKCSIAMTRTCAMGTTARIFNRPTMEEKQWQRHTWTWMVR